MPSKDLQIKPTETPASAGLQATTPRASTGSSGDAPAPAPAASDAPVYVPPAGQDLSGPGPELGTNWSLSIPAIGVSASIYSRTIGGDGQMGNPSGPTDVVWYDFAADGWTGLGGAPGQPGGNVVLAGHVDYIHYGAAVFWSTSRNELWVKGDTSGHLQHVQEIRVDCDADAVLLKVEQVGGVACHEGYRSCFFRRAEGGAFRIVETKPAAPVR